jgi:hypothetical protein
MSAARAAPSRGPLQRMKERKTPPPREGRQRKSALSAQDRGLLIPNS